MSPFTTRENWNLSDEEKAMSQRTIQSCVDCGKDTIWEHGSQLCRCYACSQRREAAQREAGSATWKSLAMRSDRFEELYALVESYLCTPNTEPVIEDHYKRLVAWFVRNKRPDGSEPRPVSPEQRSIEAQSPLAHKDELAETIQDAAEYFDAGTGLPGTSCVQ
jgi:hypothetical protein